MSMRQPSRLRNLVAGAVIVAGGLVSQAVPAAAEPSDPEPAAQGEIEAQALAPPCFHVNERRDFWGKYADVQSHCNGTYRVKVIVAFGFDSGCQYMVPGERFTHSYGHAGRFDRLDLC